VDRRLTPPASLAAAILRDGFVIAERRLDPATLEQVRTAHAHSIATADNSDARTSRSGGDTRVHLNPNAEILAQLHRDPILRSVAADIMPAPFGLNYFLSRTLHPGASPQDLHIDCEPGAERLIGFIYMLDDFTKKNGATQFVRGSHRGATPALPALATGPAGSLIIYDRAVLHGYTANATNRDRRSIQGGFDPA
jgi:ectoine hydroxylase-related dioxygenase (phytanoyl-CoA dioxygenase family)